MKKKLDFVTNSSSTAFCVWGVCIPFSEQKKINNERLEELEYDSDIRLQSGEGDGMMYGVSPNMMKPNQTLNEFKQEISELLKEIGLDVEIEDIGFLMTEVLC